jgi:tRNA threonylcarbamoyladenosine biosynthesis protein TsaB
VRILGLDTATRATTAALLDTVGDAEPTQARDDPPPGVRPRHTTRLMSLLVETLERAQTSWSELDRIAVGVGPGSFTGLRIGVATARALGRAHGMPLVGISTLQSLAAGAAGAGPDATPWSAADSSSALPAAALQVLAVLDARRDEVFAAGWRADARAGALGDRVLSPVALAPGALAATIAALGPGWLAVGDGAVEFRGLLERSGTWIPADDSDLHRVTAVSHCRLASGLEAVAPEKVSPEYLRIPDAEINLRAADRR